MHLRSVVVAMCAFMVLNAVGLKKSRHGRDEDFSKIRSETKGHNEFIIFLTCWQ